MLLLTANVSPDASVPMLRARDPEQRRREYLQALDFYLKLTGVFHGVVFAENSGADLSPFRALARKHDSTDRFEALHVPLADPKLGRGVGEAELVRSAMSDSEILRALAPNQHVWKVTGRYVVRNLKKLAESAPTDADLYINVRTRPMLWCDTYAYAFTRPGYDDLLSLGRDAVAAEAGTGPTGEQTMARFVLAHMDGTPRIVPRFKYEPRREGVRGSDLKSYGSFSQRVKYLTRVVARRALPDVWI